MYEFFNFMFFLMLILLAVKFVFNMFPKTTFQLSVGLWVLLSGLLRLSGVILLVWVAFKVNQ